MKSKLFILSLVVALLSSCTGVSQLTLPQTNLNIIGADVQVGSRVSFTDQKVYVFGIGGMSKTSRKVDMVEELFKKANLGPNETLAYISRTRNVSSYVGIVTIVRHTISGYIVSPVDKNTNKETPVQTVVNTENASKPVSEAKEDVRQKELDAKKKEAEAKKKEAEAKKKEAESKKKKEEETKKKEAEAKKKEEDAKKKEAEAKKKEEDAKKTEEAIEYIIQNLKKSNSKDEILKLQHGLDSYVKNGIISHSNSISIYKAIKEKLESL